MAGMARWTAATVAASRSWLAAGAGRVRSSAVEIAETTAAATIAWLIATRVFHHQVAFFAPAAALITLGITRGQRLRRAVEIVVGVAVGVLVADVISRAIGPGTVWSIAVIIGLTLVTAAFIGGGPIFLVQATVSAIYISVVSSPGSGFVPQRFVDALIGGGVALLANQLPLHRDPIQTVVEQAQRLLHRLGKVLDGVAAAVDAHDVDAARSRLEEARAMDPEIDALREAVATGFDEVRLDPRRRRRMAPLRVYEEAVRQCDYAVRNVRVLARSALGLNRTPYRAPEPLIQALRELAEACRDLEAALREAAYSRTDPAGARDDTGAPSALRRHVLTAVRLAGSVLTRQQPLPVVMIIGQIRMTAVDLLRGSGLELAEVLRLTDQALGLPELAAEQPTSELG
jgi:uncharacterized membrane protein YgaE (UPF0421/DUF939 family)